MEQIADLIGRHNVSNAIIIIVLIAMAFVYVFFCEVHFRENKLMSNQKVVISRQGIGFFGLLFVVLLVLKLGVAETAVVGWSWWWVTAPLWGPTCLLLGIILLALVIFIAIMIIGWICSAILSHMELKKKAKKAEQAKE